MTVKELHAAVREIARDFHQTDYSQIEVKTDWDGTLKFSAYIDGPGRKESFTTSGLLEKLRGENIEEDMQIEELPFVDTVTPAPATIVFPLEAKAEEESELPGLVETSKPMID